MRLPLTIEILRRGDWFIARTPELDFISQGRTSDEAKSNLLEVMKIQIAEMKEMGTLEGFSSYFNLSGRKTGSCYSGVQRNRCGYNQE